MTSRLNALTEFFDEEVGTGLIERVRTAPLEHLEQAALHIRRPRELPFELRTGLERRLTGDSVTLVSIPKAAAVEDLLLQQDFTKPMQSCRSLKSSLLYHRQTLCRDPLLAWAVSLGPDPWIEADEFARNDLIAVLKSITPLEPFIEAGTLLLVPSPYEWADAWTDEPVLPTPEATFAAASTGIDWNSLSADLKLILRPRQGVWDGEHDLLSARLIARQLKIPDWQFTARGLDPHDAEDLLEGVDYAWSSLSVHDRAVVVDTIAEELKSAGDFESLPRVASLRSWTDAYRASVPIAVSSRSWSQLVEWSALELGVLPSGPEPDYFMQLPSVEDLSLHDLATLHADDEIFSWVREALGSVYDAVSGVDTDTTSALLKNDVAQLAADILEEPVARLRREVRSARWSRLVPAAGGGLVSLGLSVLLSPLGGWAASRVAEPAARRGATRATRARRARSAAAETGLSVLGSLVE